MRITAKAAAATTLFVALVLVAYTLYMGVNLEELLDVNPLMLAAATAAYTAAWLVSAYRLMVLDRYFAGEPLGLRHYFYARILGGVAAYLTPSAIGGEPVRAHYLARARGDSTAGYFALTIYEVYYDVVFTAAAAAAASLLYLPYTIPVLIVSAASLGVWAPMPLIILRGGGRLYRFIVKRFSGIVAGQVAVFLDSYRRVMGRCGARCVAAMVSTTILYHLLNTATILLLCWPIAPWRAFAGYIYALSMGALPTPGGAGVMEYGYTLAMPPPMVVRARAFTVLYTMVLGLYVLNASRGILLTGLAGEGGRDEP